MSATKPIEKASLVPRPMAMAGHEPANIYRRDAIQDEAMLREGAAKLDAFHKVQAGETKKTRGQLTTFRRKAR